MAFSPVIPLITCSLVSLCLFFWGEWASGVVFLLWLSGQWIVLPVIEWAVNGTCARYGVFLKYLVMLSGVLSASI